MYDMSIIITYTCVWSLYPAPFAAAGARPGGALHAAIYNDTQTYVIKRPSPGRHAPRAQPRPRTESRDRGSQNRTSNPRLRANCARAGGAHACIGLGVRTHAWECMHACTLVGAHAWCTRGAWVGWKYCRGAGWECAAHAWSPIECMYTCMG